MALITPSIFFTAIKGSVGGTTFSNNRAGLTAKKRLVGKRLLNNKQSVALNNSMATTVAWNALSSAQKTEFNNYALANTYTSRYGTIKPLTGYQWFKQLSQTSNYFTGSQLTDPPAYSIPAALPSIGVFVEHPLIVLEWSVPIDLSTTSVYCYTTPPVRGQARVQRGLYRLTDIRSIDYSSFFDITDAWNAAHGLDFATLSVDAVFNIGVLMFAVDNTSFNSGVAVTAFGANL